MEEDVRSCKEAGFDDPLTNPINFQKLDLGSVAPPASRLFYLPTVLALSSSTAFFPLLLSYW